MQQDPRYDFCQSCKGDRFALHHLEWERVCMDCGVVSPIEFSLEDAPVEQKHYSRNSYFINSVVKGLVKKGAPISNEEIELLHCMFQRSQALFAENKEHLQRKNYPSAQFVVYKLAQHLGKDLTQWIKLPKLKATRDRVEADWVFIDPANY